MTQVPAASGVRVVALTVQTLVVSDSRETLSPEVDTAVRVVAEAGSVIPRGVGKIMVCAPLAIWNIRVTAVAG